MLRFSQPLSQVIVAAGLDITKKNCLMMKIMSFILIRIVSMVCRLTLIDDVTQFRN